jgi:3-methylfumaryl-CoA hydratase
MSASSEKLDDWLNKEAVVKDDITAFPLAALAATLDREESGNTVPPLWHWLYFLPVAPMAEVGPDGHPKRGGFLPPVPLPRRMWAGGRLTFHAPLKVGEHATRTSTIANIEDKTGRSGRLVFVTANSSSKKSTTLFIAMRRRKAHGLRNRRSRQRAKRGAASSTPTPSCCSATRR